MIPDWLQKQLVDKSIIIKRCTEELDLCVDEMNLFLLFYGKKSTMLDTDCNEISQRISGIVLFLLTMPRHVLTFLLVHLGFFSYYYMAVFLHGFCRS